METFGVKDFREGMTTLVKDTLAGVEEAKGKPLQDSAVKLIKAKVVFEGIEKFVNVLTARAEKYNDQPRIYEDLRLAVIRCELSFAEFELLSQDTDHIVHQIRSLLKRLQSPLPDEVESIVLGTNVVAAPVANSFRILEELLD